MRAPRVNPVHAEGGGGQPVRIRMAAKLETTSRTYCRVSIASKYVLGLKWRKIGRTRPAHGQQLTDDGLASALLRKQEFSRQEWDAFGIQQLRRDHYVLVGDLSRPSGGYYEPDYCMPDPIKTMRTQWSPYGTSDPAWEETFRLPYEAHEDKLLHIVVFEQKGAFSAWVGSRTSTAVGELMISLTAVERGNGTFEDELWPYNLVKAVPRLGAMESGTILPSIGAIFVQK